MNLVVSVGESEELTNVFVESGRVRELVDGLAISSRAILSANERSVSGKGQGSRSWGGRRGQAETKDIWNVGGGGK